MLVFEHCLTYTLSKSATEVVAAGIILQYWAPNLQSWIPALVFIVVLVGINLIGVRVYGELEYWFALIKVITCVLFIFVGKFISESSEPMGVAH